MTSFHARVDHMDAAHMALAVFAGPDAEHRALAGRLVFRPEEAVAFMEALPADTSADVTPQIAAHVLWHYGLEGGYEPGSFVAQLLRTIAQADVHHRARLSLAYPGHVAAASAVERSADGALELRALAGQVAA